ncbi:hypothetical protein MFLAVUS_001829 [Mucor flavus]|uniref:Galactose oxidase n=1 Tax=Mucor flavus TaxID=439312 RepID=A0ABP9YNK2_9FUNG
MRPLHWLAFVAILLGTNVDSIELRPREGQDCAFLSNKIYCYGGYILGNSGVDVLNSLDIYKNDGGPSQNLNSQWEDVTPAASNIVIGRRGFPQAAAAPDGERFLIQGGYNYDAGPIVQQTIAYNSRTNSWEAFNNYKDVNNGGDRQIYYGSGEYIPSLKQFGYFGGYQQHAIAGSNYTTLEGVSISGLTFNNSENYINSYVGFHYFTLFDINTNIWTVPPQTNVPKDYQILFSATYHPKTQKVYYIGGSYYNSTSGSIYNSFLTYARTFNTANGIWSRETIEGDAPSQREQHTTTLLPNGDDILLYGGTLSEAVAVMDYCYTLNVPTMKWRYHNLAAPAGVSGPRSHHSAVLVNNTSLFILFGLNKDATRTNELLILDVRNVDNLTFATTFPFDNVVDTAGNSTTGGTAGGNTSSENTNAGDNHKEGLSTGAIAGIAVGGVIAGALLVLALVYYSRGKKSKKGVNDSGKTTHYEQQKNTDSELLEVDWDKIDDHYKEVSLPPVSTSPISQQQQQYYAHQRHLSDDLYSDANSSTDISSSQIPNISTSNSPETRYAASPNYFESKPNSGPISPDVAIAPMIMKVVKPDGGI